ncbi:MAG: DUF3800 domain-containing protein [Phycisphaeraceae bacterium]|nr:DUF3800 domain-containing protein [Phycisphaeraceae bacterium]MBX3407903.1 DUF3800 domain-containing protein [Phycisphaeraceae bacterium]
MFIYLDESGCAGMKIGAGSSRFFTLTALEFANQETTRAARAEIRKLRDSLGCHRSHEFKFNKSSDARKAAFFEVAKELQFSVHAFTLNKERLMAGALSDPRKLIRNVTAWTLKNILDSLAQRESPARAALVFDACGQRDFYKQVQVYVQKLANFKLKDRTAFHVVAVDSKREDLLQLADMVCGAINHHREGKPKGREHLAKLHGKIKTLRIWPEAKNDQARLLSP